MTYECFLPFFAEVCQQHEFLLIFLRVIVMKLQTHILENFTTRTFISMTFQKIRFKIIVLIDSTRMVSFVRLEFPIPVTYYLLSMVKDNRM